MSAVTVTKRDFDTDLGLGPAAKARPSRLQRVEGEDRGMFRKGIVEAWRYQDAHLIDRMHHCAQLSDRQYAAAERVAVLHAEAGFEPKQSGSYVPRGWSHGHDDDSEEAAAITEFRRLLGGCVPGHAWILHEMCLGQHPGTWRLATLQVALDDLAKRWKIS